MLELPSKRLLSKTALPLAYRCTSGKSLIRQVHKNKKLMNFVLGRQILGFKIVSQSNINIELYIGPG